MNEKDTRKACLLGYVTLALMTTIIVVCVLSMLMITKSSLPLMLATLPVLLLIDWMEHRVSVGMAGQLPKRLLDWLMRLVIWAGAVVVLWSKYNHSGLTPDFVVLLVVIVQALTMLLRVIYAIGKLKSAEAKPAEDK